MTRISVIIPTIGRPTLQRAIDSCADADEIILIRDVAAGGYAHQNVLLDDRHVGRVVDLEVRGGDNGYTARTAGIRLSTGTHLAFLDDDDVFTPGALDAMRAHACDRPVIFRMDARTRGIGVLWAEPVLRYANVGTPMFLVPNRPDELGVWRAHENNRGGDYTFIKGCVEQMGDPVWVDHVICTVRPRPTITIVTPWWNHPELAAGYLRALGCADPDEVIVVDNASDPAVEFAQIRCHENLGFAKACNIGLDQAAGDAVLFLNNDIEALRPGWLDEIRSLLSPGVLVGAQLRNDDHAMVDGERYPYLDGWCFAGMRDDLLELGGFDEGYDEPSYYGDNDLCFRARLAGMTLVEARVPLRHLLGASTPHDDHRARVTQANYDRYADRVRSALQEVTC